MNCKHFKNESFQCYFQFYRGEKAEVGWGMLANHGGGYSYRLCKMDQPGTEGRKALTEDCFQKTPLKFASNKQWIQIGYDESTRQSFIANRTTAGAKDKIDIN